MMWKAGSKRLAKGRLALELAVLIIASLGCGGMPSRPKPSKAEYLAWYMSHFDVGQIESIDYTYQGAVGGAMTAARVQFRGPVAIPEDLEAITYQPPEANDHSPDAELIRMQIQMKCQTHCGGTIPDWFDFPIDRPMRMIRESEDEPEEGTPRYRNEWYIDDQEDVVYFLGNWG